MSTLASAVAMFSSAQSYHVRTPLEWALTILIAAAVMLIPLVPLVKSWRRIRQDPQASRSPIGKWLLIATTISFLWLMVGVVWKPLLGRDYSTFRYSLAWSNLLMNVVIGVIAVFQKDAMRRLLVGSSFAVALDWFYLAAVSALV